MFTWNIIGHKKITDFLESAIQNDKLSHAYLFYGPKQIGKKTLVKRFIQNLMCYHDNPQKKQMACEVCDQCVQIKKNIHPDITWLKKEADKKDITVEQIRDLQDILSVHSFFKNYKVAVIENAEQLNLASANALLKTLEEPTKKTILILTAQNINNIPKTVLSRVQKIKLLPVPAKEIYDYLLAREVARDQARNLACVAVGRPGRAVVFLNNEQVWQTYLSQLKNFFQLLGAQRVSRLKFAEKFLAGEETLVRKGEMLNSVLNLWQLILRDLFLHKLQQADKLINLSVGPDISQWAAKYSLIELVGLQQYIHSTKQQLRQNVNPRLALENLLLRF